MTKKEIQNFAEFLKQKITNPRTREFALDSRGLVPEILTREEFLQITEIYFESKYHDYYHYWGYKNYPLIRYSGKGQHELTGSAPAALHPSKIINVYAVYNEWLYIANEFKIIKNFWKNSNTFSEEIL